MKWNDASSVIHIKKQKKCENVSTGMISVLNHVMFGWVPTISEELQQCQVDKPFPAGVLLQSDAVSRGGEHFPTADGHQLAALILPGHVVQNSSVIDEGIQLPAVT